MDNIELNKQLKNGNPKTFSRLYLELQPRMLCYSRLFIKDERKNEDLIQDCFEYLWVNRASIIPEKSIESYLFVILRNKCLKQLRNSQSIDQDITIEDLSINELQYLYQLDFTEKKEKTIEERLISSLHEAIESLPPKRKEVFIKCKIQGLKQKDVADELGISLKAIEKHISQSKIHIKKTLENEDAMFALIIALILN